MLIWTEVVCDGCSDSTAGEFAKWGKRNAGDVKRAIADAGWHTDRSGKAFCHSCAKKKGWVKP